MKKFLEYTTIVMAVIGTFCMIGAVGAIEIDKWLQGGSMAMLGNRKLYPCFVFIRTL